MFNGTLFRKALLSCGLLLMLAGAAQAAQQKIIIVGGTSAPYNDADLQSFVAGIYGNRATVSLPGKDHFQHVGDTNNASSSTTEITELNGADLVIASRSMNSGTYSGTTGVGPAKTLAWNALTCKMLSLSLYTARSTNWGWLTTNTLSNPKIPLTGFRTAIVPPTDPIFLNNNVVTTASGGVRICDTPAAYAYFINKPATNGTVLATVDGISSAPTIIKWPGATGTFNATTGQTYAGPRMLFTYQDNGFAGTVDGTGPSVLNANGKKLLTNAIMSMLPTPQTTISTSMISFPTVNVVNTPNSVTTRTVTITNTGNQALNFLPQGTETNPGLVLTGAPACITISKVSQATSTPLAAGATLTITLKFAPLAADWDGFGLNNKTATLNIYTDAPTPNYTVSITAATVPVEMSHFAAE